MIGFKLNQRKLVVVDVILEVPEYKQDKPVSFWCVVVNWVVNVLELLNLGFMQIKSLEFFDSVCMDKYPGDKERYEPPDDFLSRVIWEALLRNHQVLRRG